MAENQENTQSQEIINQITEAVTKNVLEAVDQRIDERIAAKDQGNQEDLAKAKETIKRTFQK